MRTIIFFFLLGLWPAVLQAQILLGTSWSSPRELEQVAAIGLRVRYITPRALFASGDEHALQQLKSRGFTPFLIDRSGPEEAYFLTDHLDFPLLPGVELIYKSRAGWALLRLPQTRLAEIHEHHHFLWPLPEDYDLGPWLRPQRAAKPTAPLGADSMAELLALVDPAQIQAHVEALALIDPDRDSTPDNLRTRYARHPRTFESTTYIRDQLSAYLGEGAVEVQDFRHRPDEPLMYNVVGTLAGADPQAGYYVVCAHYDAIAFRTRDWDWRVDSAAGADDNATGTALVLESARVLAQQQFPSWSIRFIAFSGEELGLWGSRAYATQARERDDRILGVLNFDMIGFNDLSHRLELVANPPSRWLVDLMRQSNQRYHVGLQVDVLVDQTARLSDHAPFWARGYDALLGIENYLPTDSTTYGVRENKYRINSHYHTVRDVPDSINWELVKRTTQLAVATLAQYGLQEGEGLPNLVVFLGDLSGDPQGNLRVRVSNIGLSRLEIPYRVRVSRCGADSSGCEVIYDEERSTPLEPGGVEDIEIAWDRFGEMVFLLEVDPQGRIAESSEDDNRAFQNVRLVPQSVRVFPNPYSPIRDGILRFSGVPLNSMVQIFTLRGELVWSAQEDDREQRRLRAKPKDILWKGVNQTQEVLVGSGVYIYTITVEGEVIEMGKIAVVR